MLPTPRGEVDCNSHLILIPNGGPYGITAEDIPEGLKSITSKFLKRR
jgi:hypothetical protein